MNSQEILDNAPEGATHVSDNGVYYRYDSDFISTAYWARGKEWHENNTIAHLCSSLLDIAQIAGQDRRIAELEDYIKILEKEQTIARANKNWHYNE